MARKSVDSLPVADLSPNVNVKVGERDCGSLVSASGAAARLSHYAFQRRASFYIRADCGTIALGRLPREPPDAEYRALAVSNRYSSFRLAVWLYQSGAVEADLRTIIADTNGLTVLTS